MRVAEELGFDVFEARQIPFQEQLPRLDAWTASRLAASTLSCKSYGRSNGRRSRLERQRQDAPRELHHVDEIEPACRKSLEQVRAVAERYGTHHDHDFVE